MYLGSTLIDKLAMDGTTAVLDNISGAAFTKTGGALGAWTDPSNFRTLLGAQAPVIAEASDNLEAVPDEIFTPWASITWAAINSAAIAALAGGQYGSESAKITCGADPTGGMGISCACTAGQPHTCSCQVKANNAGAVGKTARINWDGTTADIVLTANWQTLTVTDASASGTPLTASVYFTNGANTDELAVSAWQRGNKAYKLPFARDYRTATTCKIANPLIAGQPFSAAFVVNSVWPGNDSLSHYIFSADAAPNLLYLRKYSDNNLYAWVADSAGTAYSKRVAVNATNWAAGVDHRIVMTRAANGTINAYLDGAAFTLQSGTPRTESVLNANISIGTFGTGAYPANASILCAIWGRVLTGTGTTGEIGALSSLANWADLYNSLSLAMPVATATGGVNMPSLLAEATIVCPTAMATANAPIPVVAVPTSFLGSPKQISGIAKDVFNIDGRV